MKLPGVLGVMTQTHVNSLRGKGIGEIGVTGAAAAVASAGKRVRDLPITLDKMI